MGHGLPGIGDMLGRYRLEREIGRGGMGVVWEAHDVQLDRSVALKLITPDIAENEAFRARFIREMRVAARLAHQNIVPVYEADMIDGQLFIAMQLVRGEDLKALLKRSGALSAEHCARIGVQLGAALDAAHRSGLVHRDIKPANILFGQPLPDVHVYLSDFGLAREAASESGLTSSGNWMGTIDYVAPEQLDGRAVSARSDIYAMGCLLFESLTGEVPFGGTIARKVYGHGQEPLPSVGPAGRAQTTAIDAALARATVKDPAGRFASAGDLGRAFEAAVHGHTVDEDQSVATGPALNGETADQPSSHQQTVLDGIRPASSGAALSPSSTRPTARPRRHRRALIALAVGGTSVLVAGGALAYALTIATNNPPPGPTGRTPGNTRNSTGPGVTISLAITAPSNGSRINTHITTVRGTVNPGNSKVFVQGAPADVTNGYFIRRNVTLHSGTNKIDVVATATNADAVRDSVIVLQDAPGNPIPPTTTNGGGSTTTTSTTTTITPDLTRQVTGYGWSASVPSTGGWIVGSEQAAPRAGGFKRTITGPEGQTIVIIHTPSEPAMADPKYVIGSFRLRTAAQSSEILLVQSWPTDACRNQRCTDFILNDPAWGGLAILANGTQGTSAYAVGASIAGSVRSTG